MSAPPYMRVWIAEYTADVQALSCEQDGAYWRLIRAMQRAGGKLPNKPDKLARICGLTLKRWQEIGPDVHALFKVKGGALTHSRVSKELAHYAEVSAKRKQAALATDSENFNKHNNKRGSKCKANAQQLHPKPELEVSIEPLKGSISNRRADAKARLDGAFAQRSDPDPADNLTPMDRLVAFLARQDEEAARASADV